MAVKALMTDETGKQIVDAIRERAGLEARVSDLEKNKVDKSSIAQTTGTAEDKVMSQRAVTEELEKKFDKSNVVQSTGDAEDKVMSQAAATKEFGKLSEDISDETQNRQNAVAQETAARNAAITQERNRAVARENEIEELFSLPTQAAVAKWLDEHPEATTTVQDKSLTFDKMVVGTLGYVTPQMFGAAADGITNDNASIQAAIDALQDGGVLYFPNTEFSYKVSGNIGIRNKKHITIINANMDCNGSSSCFNIYDSSDVTFENCAFHGGIQTIRLFNCDTIKVNNCTFIGCGYCIIQQIGYVSNNVFVTGNMCLNGEQDFVEANCATNASSKNWTISGNIYMRNEEPTERKTEYRFVGITSVENVIITNNIVENVQGDGAVHLEDTKGNVVIDGNIFKNCLGYGYVYIMHSEKNVVISNNVFRSTNPNIDTPFIFVYNTQDPRRTDVIVNGNEFIGHGTQSYPFTVSVVGKSLPVKFTNNHFRGFDQIFRGNEQQITFTNNDVECSTFMRIEKDYSGKAMGFLTICNNTIIGDISVRDDGNGTVFTKNIYMSGNRITGNTSFTNCKNIFVSNNYISEGYVLENKGGYYSENMVFTNNFIAGQGLQA